MVNHLFFSPFPKETTREWFHFFSRFQGGVEWTNTGRGSEREPFHLSPSPMKGSGNYRRDTRHGKSRVYRFHGLPFPLLPLNWTFSTGNLKYVFPSFSHDRSAEVRERFFPFARFPWPLSSSRLVISHSSFPFPQGFRAHRAVPFIFPSLSSFISYFKLSLLVNLFLQLFRIIWRLGVLFEEEGGRRRD